jgi:hypothetical protein
MIRPMLDHRHLPALILLGLWACGPEPDDSTPAPGDSPPDDTAPAPETVPLAGACAMAADYGGFVVDAVTAYSTVSGSVLDGVVPMTVLEEIAAEGDCRVLRRNNPFCDPPCESDETCDFDGSCLPWPETRDLGTVTITGLDVEVAMSPVAPGYTYFDTSVGHPAYTVGELVTLRTGTSPWGPVTLHGVGVDQIEALEDTWLVVAGQDLTITWPPPAAGARSEVAVRIEIDQHGTSPVGLRCSFEDDGEGIVPGTLTELIVNAGVTGYPSGSLVRRTADSVALGEEGCMDLVISSTRSPDVRVDGYTPCNDDDDCPEGQTCNQALEICE